MRIHPKRIKTFPLRSHSFHQKLKSAGVLPDKRYIYRFLWTFVKYHQLWKQHLPTEEKSSSAGYPNLLQISPEGHCEEEKDLGILDLRRLYRNPSWAELNPGRRVLKNKLTQVKANTKLQDVKLLLLKVKHVHVHMNP